MNTMNKRGQRNHELIGVEKAVVICMDRYTGAPFWHQPGYLKPVDRTFFMVGMLGMEKEGVSADMAAKAAIYQAKGGRFQKKVALSLQSFKNTNEGERAALNWVRGFLYGDAKPGRYDINLNKNGDYIGLPDRVSLSNDRHRPELCATIVKHNLRKLPDHEGDQSVVTPMIRDFYPKSLSEGEEGRFFDYVLDLEQFRDLAFAKARNAARDHSGKVAFFLMSAFDEIDRLGKVGSTGSIANYAEIAHEKLRTMLETAVEATVARMNSAKMKSEYIEATKKDSAVAGHGACQALLSYANDRCPNGIECSSSRAQDPLAPMFSGVGAVSVQFVDGQANLKTDFTNYLDELTK
jgi:hypothetical protein